MIPGMAGHQIISNSRHLHNCNVHLIEYSFLSTNTLFKYHYYLQVTLPSLTLYYFKHRQYFVPFSGRVGPAS